MTTRASRAIANTTSSLNRAKSTSISHSSLDASDGGEVTAIRVPAEIPGVRADEGSEVLKRAITVTVHEPTDATLPELETKEVERGVLKGRRFVVQPPSWYRTNVKMKTKSVFRSQSRVSSAYILAKSTLRHKTSRATCDHSNKHA